MKMLTLNTVPSKPMRPVQAPSAAELDSPKFRRNICTRLAFLSVQAASASCACCEAGTEGAHCISYVNCILGMQENC